MILNNTQANIFKVNGGIADNFANRPAASGSFYIFYSIDTQEIYYDNNAWILIGSSAGGGVNIYNNNGTLTGNRTLSGANNDLNFADLNIFKTSIGGNDIGLKLDFANNQTIIGDVAQINTGTFYIINYLNSIHEFVANNNGSPVSFAISSNINGEKIISQYQGNDIGLKLDFANTVYQFGQLSGNNNTYLQIDDFNEILKTQSSGIIDGLNFDFANEIFEFGQINSANGVHIKINGSAGIDTFQTIYNNNEQGLELQFNNQIYRFGHLFAGKQTQINIDDTLQAIILESSINIPGEEIKFIINGGINAFIKTQFQQNDIGLQLDFANTIYKLGQLTGGNLTYLTIDDAAAYPVQVDGTNVLSGTSGGSSGQHLKIKINGVDYKIALLNP